MAHFAKLSVWRKAHALALNVHRVSIAIRSPTSSSLKNQLIRAAMSVPANIVEGRGQKSSRDFARFLGYALNSTSELEYHLIVARDIRAITNSDFQSLTDQTIEVRKMLHGLSNRVSGAVGGDSARTVPSAVKLPAASSKADS